jgi:hypothetical protein
VGLERFARPTRGLRTRCDPVSPQTQSGVSGTPHASSSIVKDLVSTAAPLTPAVQGAHVANAAVSKFAVAVRTDWRAHVWRRGGRRTRTLVLAGYSRGLQPVECPRERDKKSRPRLPWGGLSRSIDRPLHSRPTRRILLRALIPGATTDGERGLGHEAQAEFPTGIAVPG